MCVVCSVCVIMVRVCVWCRRAIGDLRSVFLFHTHISSLVGMVIGSGGGGGGRFCR